MTSSIYKQPEPQPITPAVLTIDQLCEYLQMKKTTIRGLVKENQIPHYRSPGGRTLYFPKVQIDQWIAEQIAKAGGTES